MLCHADPLLGSAPCLLQGLGVSDDEAASYGKFKRTYGDLSGNNARSAAAAAGGGSSSGGGSGASTGSTAGSKSSSSAGAGGAAAKGPTLERKTTAEYVEEELAALKRKLGKQ